MSAVEIKHCKMPTCLVFRRLPRCLLYKIYSLEKTKNNFTRKLNVRLQPAAFKYRVPFSAFPQYS